MAIMAGADMATTANIAAMAIATITDTGITAIGVMAIGTTATGVMAIGITAIGITGIVTPTIIIIMAAGPSAYFSALLSTQAVATETDAMSEPAAPVMPARVLSGKPDPPAHLVKASRARLISFMP